MRRKASGNSLNSLKLKNRRDVLTVVRRTSPVSIADIAAKTSLSKVTVTKILDHYVREGLVMDVGKASSNDERGKPPTFFALNPKYGFYFVVKIDGYNMLATLTDLHGRIFASHTTLYDQRIDLQALIHCIADAFTMLVDRENLTVDKCLAAIAGLHGIIEPESGVCFLSPQFPQWGHDIPMRTMLERNLPGVPVLVDNWVHFYGRGEAAAMVEPLSRFIVITSEIEGLNGALMVDGKLYRGHDSLAGEVGHMIVDSSDAAEVCMCGGKGCFE
ncbi:MAG: ROK family transcriptional regulator, partial [Planctomycetaceae bacterium]|nr:ROK family transcriptional regulator [Planctomycetaceae bacterium]